MGSPIIAMLSLTLGYALVYAGVKNISVKQALSGQESPTPTNPLAPAQPQDSQTASVPPTQTVGVPRTRVVAQ